MPVPNRATHAPRRTSRFIVASNWIGTAELQPSNYTALSTAQLSKGGATEESDLAWKLEPRRRSGCRKRARKVRAVYRNPTIRDSLSTLHEHDVAAECPDDERSAPVAEAGAHGAITAAAAAPAATIDLTASDHQ